jgi:DNA-binding XRE family transcriptional regulator
MKKIELGLDFSEIRKRIEIDMSQYRAGMWAKMIGVKTNSISNIHGKKGKANPSLEYVTAVARVTGKPIEWYLYGTQPGEAPPERHCKFCGDMSDEIKKLCITLKDIIDSKHPVIVPALLSNLEAFKYSVDKERKQDDDIDKLKREVRHLKTLMSSETHSGSGKAAGAGMRKTKT